MGRSAVEGALAVGYTGVGTFEFLLAPDGSYYFMEVNCRIPSNAVSMPRIRPRASFPPRGPSSALCCPAARSYGSTPMSGRAM
ncbi:hypothetical protein [Streptomyces syringium]|uniref:ATP-binding protein n=1 Tax=Streptomyces syringium TaxID=76729 RepID=UPI00342D9E2D